MDRSMWQLFSEVYGFLGNSLLLPMTRTETVGLDPLFWRNAPTFESESCVRATESLELWAERRRIDRREGVDVTERVSVEFTRLFVGPSKPTAPPWETLYASGNASVGFGEATVAMRRLLREAGLALSNANHQYEDHIGIELLYLCEMCSRFAEGEVTLTEQDVVGFIERHPLSWIGKLKSLVHDQSPGGYYERLVEYGQSVLMAHSVLLRAERMQALPCERR